MSMDRARIDTPDPARLGDLGARAEGAIPARVERETAARLPERAARTRFRTVLRIVRDAAIVVAVMAMIPIGLVATRGDHVWGDGTAGSNIRSRVARAESLRPLAVAKDPSITPMQAGLALASLQKVPKNTDFAMRAPVSPPKATWRDVELTPAMFVSAKTKLYNGPSSQMILGAVAAGFSPAETNFLRTLATAPVWREFDLVARAEAVDVIGGRYSTPFAAGLFAADMPQHDMAALREVANAAVARAAYHLSLGQKDSAETILRSIISVGFAIIDNGTSFQDEFAGNVIVGIGRDAVQRYYAAVGDPRATSPVLKPSTSVASALLNPAPLPPDLVRAALLDRVADPAIHRAERYEWLKLLVQSSCTNVPELLFGPRKDVRDALAKARTDLARYLSEQAVVDLVGSTPRPGTYMGRYGPVDMFVVSAGSVAGTVLRNPRLAACARATTAPQFRY